MEKVNRIANQADDLLNEICERIQIAFIAEYVQAMQPLASALVIMQSERKRFMGIYIPNIVSLKNKLVPTRQLVKQVTPSVDALLSGIETCSDHLLR